MKLLILLLVLFLTGCATVSVETPDCKATYTTMFKDMEAGNFTVCGGAAEVVGTDTDLEAMVKLLGAVRK